MTVVTVIGWNMVMTLLLVRCENAQEYGMERNVWKHVM